MGFILKKISTVLYVNQLFSQNQSLVTLTISLLQSFVTHLTHEVLLKHEPSLKLLPFLISFTLIHGNLYLIVKQNVAA
uniref:Putative ovule protein n=1 Tax=Solanum chacoense TaxID=4108 RepID=A0A0V0H6U8_SOLCH